MKPFPSRPKRILMTADPISSVWNHAVELIRALASQNCEVAFATFGASLSRGQRREIKQLPHVELYESNFKLEWMENPWSDMEKAGHWLLEIEKRTLPDVIHLNHYAAADFPFRAPKLVAAHSCLLSWAQALKKEGLSKDRERYRETVQNGLRSANLVIAPTRAMLRQLEALYGSFPGKVIFHGRDPSRFLAARKEEFIFVTGRLWDEARNISALAVVAPELPWSIYAAGDERHPGGRTLKFKSLQFLGRLPADLLAKWYGRASIYSLPARYDPSGASVLEAALAGCALVLGNIPSLREIWNGVALFVSPDDPDELKAVLSQLIYNPIRRKEFAAYAQCRAIQLTAHRMAGEYFAAYSELMGKKPITMPALVEIPPGLSAVA